MNATTQITPAPEIAPSERRATGKDEHLALRLAAFAGLAATLASVAGFIPGLYRDPKVIVDQSHGYDVANLVVVIVLELALLAASRGSVRGHLIAIGALGCVFYSFVTYAFLIVFNPATLLYIAVLGFAGWSFVAGIAHIEDAQVEGLVEGRLARRTTSAFLGILAVLFAVTWLSQIAGALISGNLPPDLAAAGWPMNPVWVEDLGFVLPLAAMTALRLGRRQAGAERIAVSFLVFDMLLALSILLMGVSAGLAGQPVAIPMIAIFVVLLTLSGVLCWLALRPRYARGRSVAEVTEGSSVDPTSRSCGVRPCVAGRVESERSQIQRGTVVGGWRCVSAIGIERMARRTASETARMRRIQSPQAHAVPGLPAALDTLKVDTVSLPIALGLLLMMYRVLARVKYEELSRVGRAGKLFGVSLGLNWLLSPVCAGLSVTRIPTLTAALLALLAWASRRSMSPVGVRTGRAQL